jgi:DNA-binding CsgD family transcriptional regulator
MSLAIEIKAGSGSGLKAGDLVALGLTERQAEILVWLAVGKTDGEIAKILAISPRTVSHTLARVYRKLGVENRVGAVTHALRHSGSRAR